MNTLNNSNSDEFLSTRQAAAKLGVALSTVQAWVETGLLPAWKTAGGHRRIAATAVEALRNRQQAVLGSGPVPGKLKILVVEDEPVQRELYRQHFSNWNLPVSLLIAEDGFDGLIYIGRHSPDVIITDLAMPELDGFKMIRRLNSLNSLHKPTIIVVSGLSAQEIDAQGGLPDNIPVYPKPIPFVALRLLIEHLAKRPGVDAFSS